MRRIRINDDIQKMANCFSKNLFANRRKNFDMPIDKLKSLETLLRTKSQGEKYAEYVHTILVNYSDILKLKPNEFDSYKIKKFSNLTDVQLRNPVPGFSEVNGIANTHFYELVVDAMRYSDLQKKDYRPYIRKLGIRTCVYCNAQYALTTTENNGERVTYQLDHFKPKSEYPFLCTSFFNLQPSCGHCNQSKSNKPALFGLYTEDDDLSPFLFHVDRASIIKYMLSHDCDCLNIKLDVDPKSAQNLKLLQNHQEIFHIDQMYSELKDSVEEIIWKSNIYNKTYRDQLKRQFKNLFPNGIVNFPRFFYGFYISEDEVLKRPLTKLMQDLSKEIGLIDK